MIQSRIKSWSNVQYRISETKNAHCPILNFDIIVRTSWQKIFNHGRNISSEVYHCLLHSSIIPLLKIQQNSQLNMILKSVENLLQYELKLHVLVEGRLKQPLIAPNSYKCIYTKINSQQLLIKNDLMKGLNNW